MDKPTTVVAELIYAESDALDSLGEEIRCSDSMLVSQLRCQPGRSLILTAMPVARSTRELTVAIPPDSFPLNPVTCLRRGSQCNVLVEFFHDIKMVAS